MSDSGEPGGWGDPGRDDTPGWELGCAVCVVEIASVDGPAGCVWGVLVLAVETRFTVLGGPERRASSYPGGDSNGKSIRSTALYIKGLKAHQCCDIVPPLIWGPIEEVLGACAVVGEALGGQH